MKHWRKRPLTCRQGPSENETLPEKPLTCPPKSTRWLRRHPVLHLLAPLGGPIFRRQGRWAGTAPPDPVAAAPAPVPPCSPPPRGWRRHRRLRLRRHRGSGSARNGPLSGRCSSSIVLLPVQRPAAAAAAAGATAAPRSAVTAASAPPPAAGAAVAAALVAPAAGTTPCLGPAALPA